MATQSLAELARTAEQKAGKRTPPSDPQGLRHGQFSLGIGPGHGSAGPFPNRKGKERFPFSPPGSLGLELGRDLKGWI
ncbi:hypothetical protein BHR40_24690 [Aeromonas salmonicida subsp. salmonicida]|nr:hypothetical protein BHR40_24690 [Aeromonas salmonicida subsp. salmonicida]